MSDHITRPAQLELRFTPLCECGCGQPAPIAKRTSREFGAIKGQPQRFIQGHYARIQPHLTLEGRFWKYVTPGPFDECWEWQGCTSHGYGHLNVNYIPVGAHRISWEIHFGPVPDGLFVLHKCDNPPCCNPYHLFLGTNANNVADMMAKGRHGYTGSPGESHPNAKLTNIDVIEIRHLSALGLSQRKLAEQFGVSQRTIMLIVGRKAWKHVP